MGRRLVVFEGQPQGNVFVHYICSIVLLVNVFNMVSSSEYLELREKVINQEKELFYLGEENLTEAEEKVNEYLGKLKKEELDYSYKNSSAFLPRQNFLEAKSAIENSKIFQLIKLVPKGASLHTHFLAAVKPEFIIQNFTYQENVYGCYNNLNIFKLRVLQNPTQDKNCTWKSLREYRKEFSASNKNFDEFLKSKLALGPQNVDESRESLWNKFKNTFSTLYDLVSYRPFFKKYITQIMEELYEDNIFYIELRGTFMPLYELDQKPFDAKKFLDTFIETVEEFKKTHPEFLGAKYIHSIYRGVDNNTFRSNLEELLYYKNVYPDFIAGFDFVGLEEDGRPLIDFHEELLAISKDLKFYFHAGESFQFGHTDLNLVDAILLNVTRIGHGFALAKHPKLLELAKERDIAIELSSISNQVLKLNDDPRNHPATVLLSKGYPVVICNDDPSSWDSTGLSYDWYVVFMSMTWEDHGLKLLKKFAKTSIQYSAMSETEKAQAMNLWLIQWDKFVHEIASSIYY